MKPNFGYFVLAFSLIGCSYKSPQPELKSPDYYMSHSAEVEPFLKQCEIAQSNVKNEKEWSESNLAINCSNARYALRQIKLQETNKKYDLPYVPAK
jgi:hypothetical protein